MPSHYTVSYSGNPNRGTLINLNIAALFAALAAAIAVYAHGVVGHRWLVAQLRSVEMEPTPLSRRLFGNREIAWQVLDITWHIATTVFLASSVTLLLTGLGALGSRDLLRFVAILYVAFLAMMLFFVEKRLDVVAQPIPMLFVAVMIAVACLSWVASGSV